jgi:hypothetical protein
MTSAAFLLRFKNKSSTLDKTGALDLSLSRPVDLPKLPPLSPQILRVNTLLSSAETHPDSKTRFKTTSSRIRPVRSRDLSAGRVGYHPCTLEEFQTLVQRTYWELGRLGPSRRGTQRWEEERRVSDRKQAYGRAVRMARSTGRCRPSPGD